MSEWKEYKLGEIVKLIGGGTPNTTNSNYWGGDIPWLSVGDFNKGRKYVYDAEKHITQEGLNNSSTKILHKEDIIISARGTVGVVAMIGREMAFNQSCYGVRGKELIDQQYLYYLLIHSVQGLKQNAYGGVFDTITRETFDLIDISLPPIEEQKRIAGVLSSLDDKIDLLNLENATLEALAETLFRHYFIENPDPTWKEMPVSCYGKVICGKTPSKKNTEYFGGEVPFIKIPDMHGKTYVFNSEDSLSEEGKLSQKEKTLPKESIMVSCIATVGLVSMNAYEAQTNQQINSVVPYDEQYRYYLYCWFKSMYDELIAMASGGTATLNLNTGDFSRIGIPVPNETAIKEFHLQVEPLFAKIKSNQQQMQTLTAQRDTLLSRLMSGDVRVTGQ